MLQQIDLGPVEISYAAALRGTVPRPAGAAFRYLRCGRMDAEAMLCLAASNPEGVFLFVLESPEAAAESGRSAARMRLGNVSFLGMSLAELDAALATGQIAVEPADYLVADLQDADQAALDIMRRLAPRLTREGGLCALRYAPFPQPGDSLRFMAAEFAPEISPAEHGEFLRELRQLGHAYFARSGSEGALLDAAIAGNAPHIFLQSYTGNAKPSSATIATISAMVPAGFGFVGEASAAGNYLEMVVPKPAQDALYALRSHLLYEVIKDFSSDRPYRTDIWARQPAAMDGNLAVLFGGFFFGLADMTGTLPRTVRAGNGEVDLSVPILDALLRLMQLMPITVGDFLSHGSGKAFTPLDVIMAVQILVACGVVAPMRASFDGAGKIDTAYPRLAGQFNQQLRGAALDGTYALLASTVAGRPLKMSLPEALVLQAVDRVGFAESTDALMPELERISSNPAQAGLVFAASDTPASDFAETMIRQVCERNFVNWYAFGVLDAA